MAKYDLKTKATVIKPKDFIASLEDGTRKSDAQKLLPWMEKVTGLKGKMWGPSIIGFGRYHYEYESGHSGDMCMTGFSPRKANMVVYILPGYAGLQDKLVRLGPHKTGKSCLYLGSLDKIDMDVLGEIVGEGVAYIRKTYKTSDA